MSNTSSSRNRRSAGQSGMQLNSWHRRPIRTENPKLTYVPRPEDVRRDCARGSSRANGLLEVGIVAVAATAFQGGLGD